MSFMSDIIGSVIGADSNRHAVNVQTDAANRATDLQKYMYDQARTDNMPALDARNSGIAQLRQLLGIGGDPKAANYGALNQQYTGANLQNDPGYQFGLQQGTDAIQGSAAARGGLFSGATQKALAKYGQDYAGTKFNEGFNRFQAQQDSTFNRLAGLSGLGQTGSNQIGMAGQNYANQAGQNMIGIGNAQAAAGMNQANMIGNGLNSLASWGSRNNWGRQSSYDGYMPSPFSGSGTGFGIGGGDGFTTDPYAGF